MDDLFDEVNPTEEQMIQFLDELNAEVDYDEFDADMYIESLKE